MSHQSGEWSSASPLSRSLEQRHWIDVTRFPWIICTLKQSTPSCWTHILQIQLTVAAYAVRFSTMPCGNLVYIKWHDLKVNACKNWLPRCNGIEKNAELKWTTMLNLELAGTEARILFVSGTTGSHGTTMLLIACRVYKLWVVRHPFQYFSVFLQMQLSTGVEPHLKSNPGSAVYLV